MSTDVAPEDADKLVTLGERLRTLRSARNRSLTTLARDAGTSASFLSQVERGRSSVSLSTLQRIADALSVNLGDMFDSSRPVPLHVMNTAQRPTVTAGDGGVALSWVTATPARHVEAYYGTFAPGAALQRATPRGDSQELLLVERGQIQLDIGGADYLLSSGSSIEYSSSMTYRVQNVEDVDAVVLWIITPPTGDAADLGAHVEEDIT